MKHIVAAVGLSAVLQFVWMANADSSMSLFLFGCAAGMIFPLVLFAKNLKQAVTTLLAVCAPIPVLTFGVLLLVLVVGAFKKGLGQVLARTDITIMFSATILPYILMVLMMSPVFAAAVMAKYTYKFVRK